MVTLLLVPHTILYYIGGFFLFRFFDILKPFPIRKLEKFPRGLGIMVDDIGAGLYAREVDYLVAQEWATTAEDLLWRRTKCGLHMSPMQHAAVDRYLQKS